jgi:hypothetical protein
MALMQCDHIRSTLRTRDNVICILASTTWLTYNAPLAITAASLRRFSGGFLEGGDPHLPTHKRVTGDIFFYLIEAQLFCDAEAQPGSFLTR